MEAFTGLLRSIGDDFSKLWSRSPFTVIAAIVSMYFAFCTRLAVFFLNFVVCETSSILHQGN